ncbi:uncharacterized protein TNCV_1085611 [Trichonephila clavipes]|nr:uncharacterized protein TNCV_1085611 [Trichonephila clavipes]
MLLEITVEICNIKLYDARGFFQKVPGSQMPPKKSNLNNASSKGSRRKRVERAQQLPEQIETRNAAQRIRTAESRARESQEQRDERLQQNITRTRVARERNIATVRALDRQRQRISRSLTRASFVRLALNMHQLLSAFKNCYRWNGIKVSPRLQNDNYQIVIKADKVPLGEHAGRFNAPTVDEVAVIMVGDPVDKRSIKITRRDNTISDYRNNKVSSMNYYAHRIMTLVYGDVPRYFTWNKSSKKWEPRKQGKPHPSITGIFKAKTLGRLYTVHPKQRECFYLRLLLVNVPGPTSFEFLRTVNGRVFNTYQDACRELQLLEDDNHWDLTLADAALTSTPNNIRQLFAIILTTCYPSQAQTLWEKYKNCMTEDILHRIRQTNQSQNIDYTPEMYNEALVLIEDLCVLISNLPLNHYGMPSPNRPATDLVNTDLQRENQYDHGSLATIIMNSEPLLTAEQKIIYDRIMLAVAAEQGGFFFGCTRWNRRKVALHSVTHHGNSGTITLTDSKLGKNISFAANGSVTNEFYGS